MILLLEPEQLEIAAETPLAEIVLAAQDGDQGAFNELVTRFEKMVFATVSRRISDYSEAQEVAQEVFVRAWRKLESLQKPECFGGWIRSIAVRLSLNRLSRRKGALATEPEILNASYADSRTPLDYALRRESQEQVRDGLDRLGDLDRETLLAFYVKGQSIAQMSQEFHSPEGTIKRRLHVARKRLAAELEECAAL